MQSGKSQSHLEWLLENVPDVVNMEDGVLSEVLLETDLETIKDTIKFLAVDERLLGDEYSRIGPLKFQYEEGDSYDWHVAMGCLNCGAAYTIRDSHASLVNMDFLTCMQCGYQACPKHYEKETDGATGYWLYHGDKMPQGHKAVIPPPPRFGQLENWSDTYASESSNQTTQTGGTYLYGIRKQYQFGQSRKVWWQERFLSEDYRQSQLQHQLRVVDTVNQRKGEICKEECEKCGHNEAFFHCFQARSADEGMTIMYECCKCAARKVFNS